MKTEYLVLWKDYPIEEAQWVPAKNFIRPSELQKYIEEDDPQKERYSYEDITIVKGGVVVRSVVLCTSSTRTNEPTGEDLCAGYLNGRDRKGNI